jgi:hypothetical protein
VLDALGVSDGLGVSLGLGVSTGLSVGANTLNVIGEEGVEIVPVLSIA